jgi:hypothetical protein
MQIVRHPYGFGSRVSITCGFECNRLLGDSGAACRGETAANSNLRASLGSYRQPSAAEDERHVFLPFGIAIKRTNLGDWL